MILGTKIETSMGTRICPVPEGVGALDKSLGLEELMGGLERAIL